jgi:hypothetical protein
METHARIIGEEKNKDLIRRLADIGFKIVEEEGFVITLQRPA